MSMHRSPQWGMDALASLLALLVGWTALFGWRGLVEQPGRFQGAALITGLLVAGLGLLLRRRHWHWWQVAGVQVVAMGLLLHEHVSGHLSRWWLVPTPRGLEHLVDQLDAGVRALSTEYSPVPAAYTGAADVLLVGSLVLLLSLDVLACGLRRVPLAGLPVLVVWMFPISLLNDGLGWRVFAVTSLLFVLLLAVEETNRVLAWGRGGTSEQVRSGGLVSSAALRARALSLGAVACLAAVVLPVFVPLGSPTFGPGNGEGPGGDGQGTRVVVQNPFVNMHRDLVRPDPVPLVEASTDAKDKRYLRLTVLDTFSGAVWRPSPRLLHEDNTADGEFPPTPGLSNQVPGNETRWSLRLLPDFATAWLPTPYPLRSLAIADDRWRFHDNTQDIAAADGHTFNGTLEYDAVGFVPDFTGLQLDRAVGATGDPLDRRGPDAAMRNAMTDLPSRMPEVIAETARRVTRGARTDYQRAQKLQDFLRSDEFEYSTDRAPGSGLQALAKFLTTDKVGYCEQFAAAFGVMARSLGMPTRVVVGFLAPDERDGATYRWTSDSLHAWPEVYFTGYGWVGFEPTPADHTGRAPAWTTADVTNETAAPSPTAAPTAAPVPTPRPEQNPNAGKGGGGLHLLPVLLLVVVAGLALLVVPVLVRRRRRTHRLAATAAPADVATGLWEELRASVHDLGIDWPEGRSVRQQTRTLLLRAKPADDLRARIAALVDFVERARYARPFTMDEVERAAHVATVHDWVALLAGTVAKGQARRARLFPRSVWSEPTVQAGDAESVSDDREDELV